MKLVMLNKPIGGYRAGTIIRVIEDTSKGLYVALDGPMRDQVVLKADCEPVYTQQEFVYVQQELIALRDVVVDLMENKMAKQQDMKNMETYYLGLLESEQEEKRLLLSIIERTIDEQKVNLPREVAIGIQIAKENGDCIETIVRNALMIIPDGPYYIPVRDFAAGNFFELLRALVNGYTVEDTPQERIKRGVQSIYEEWTSIPSTGNDAADGADLAQRISKFVVNELRL